MYEAIVTPIRTRPHPDADRIQLGTVHGHQVVVGLDVDDNTLGVFFPSDGQLSDAFCKANDLYPVYDEQGKKIGGGFFDPVSRRVRAQNFRGERSEGYWCPLSSLEKWAEAVGEKHVAASVAKLKTGDTFSTLGGHEVCCKYFNAKTLQRMANKNTRALPQHPDFLKHLDTKQFRYELDKVPIGSLITITEKLHGTSARYGLLPVDQPEAKGFLRKALVKCARWLCKKTGLKVARPYALLSGSRNVVLEFGSGPEMMENFRYVVSTWLSGRLRNGEVIYGEIVGWEGPNKATIMAKHNPVKVSKAFVKTFGKDPFVYAYGCSEGTYRFFPYRIEQVTPEGCRIELSHRQMAERCADLGLLPVPLLADQFVVTDRNELEKRVKAAHQEKTVLDQHPSEGVIVRVDTPDGHTYFLKDKNFAFKVMEDIAKADGDVDLEEIS